MSCRRTGGFSLIEMIVVIVVLGVLAAIVTPRLVDSSVFEARGFRDQLASAARDAQRYARNSGCPTNFSVGGGTWSVTTTVPCGGSSQTVAGFGGPLSGNIPGGISISEAPLVVTFDAWGAASSGSSVTVTAGSENAAFVIQGGSGYVNLP